MGRSDVHVVNLNSTNASLRVIPAIGCAAPTLLYRLHRNSPIIIATATSRPTTGPITLAPASFDVCGEYCAGTVGGTRLTEESTEVDDVMGDFTLVDGASIVGEKTAKEGPTVAEAIMDNFVLVDDAGPLVLGRVIVGLEIILYAAEIDDTPDSVNVKVVKSCNGRK